jgi:hypothetical protein
MYRRDGQTEVSQEKVGRQYVAIFLHKVSDPMFLLVQKILKKEKEEIDGSIYGRLLFYPRGPCREKPEGRPA